MRVCLAGTYCRESMINKLGLCDYVLESFGEDINREGLKETPRRVAGYWKELLEGNNYTNKEIADKFNKKRKSG